MKSLKDSEKRRENWENDRAEGLKVKSERYKIDWNGGNSGKSKGLQETLIEKKEKQIYRKVDVVRGE